MTGEMALGIAGAVAGRVGKHCSSGSAYPLPCIRATLGRRLVHPPMKKLIALLIFVAVVIGAAWIAFGADYSDGYRVGQVIKLSRSGYVFKTWEGTLDFGFLQQDPTLGTATRLWDFSVRDGDDAVRKDIDDAIAVNAKVKLYYHEKYFRWSFFGDTKHFVYKLERVH